MAASRPAGPGPAAPLVRSSCSWARARCSSAGRAGARDGRTAAARDRRLRRRPAPQALQRADSDPPGLGQLRAPRASSPPRSSSCGRRPRRPRRARSLAVALPRRDASLVSSRTSPAAPTPRPWRRPSATAHAASMSHEGRTFHYGRADAVDAVNALAAGRRRITEPGDRSSSGPATCARRRTARRTSTTCSPSSTPATRYIEMDPGVANAAGLRAGRRAARRRRRRSCRRSATTGTSRTTPRSTGPTSRTRCSRTSSASSSPTARGCSAGACTSCTCGAEPVGDDR